MPACPKAGAPGLQIAEVFRRFADRFRNQHALAAPERRVLRDLEHCHTAALGEHVYHCDKCGRDVPLYNSCLNRHCPTCQGPAQYRWIEQRQRRLLNTGYFHVVFTLPATLRAVVFAHRRILLNLLFCSVAQTLHAFAARDLQAQLAFTLVLHTWTRQLLFHPHLHAIVTAGGLSFDGTTWVGTPSDDFLFHAGNLSEVFRGKFLHGFIDLCQAGKIDLTEHQSRKLVREAKKHDWVVYAKKPFGGPEQIVNYLGRYTHRVGISSSRLLSITDHRIVFRTRGEKTCSLEPQEFIRRFLLHVLPHQFFKIRHYGLLAPGNVNSRLRTAQDLLGPIPEPTNPDPDVDHDSAPHNLDDANPTPSRCADRASPKCPHCGGLLLPVIRRTLRLVEIPPPDS